MMRILFVVLLTPLCLWGQTPFSDPDSTLVRGDDRSEVLLVGTFHFNYPNLDAHKIEADKQIDILSPNRQQEVEELVDYLVQFRPTMVVVEAGRNTGYLMKKYQRWKAGTRPMGRGEIEQLGFRLMDRLGLDTLYGCDATSIPYDMSRLPDSLVFQEYLAEIFQGYDYQSDDPYAQRYTEFYDYKNHLRLEHTLLEAFQYGNSRKVLERGYGAYLLGDFRNRDYAGADALALYWYNRNLRIYRNIQRLEIEPEDRVLVLFGSGHISILDHLFRSSPEFQLVPFSGLEGE